MSIHAQPSQEAKARLRKQRRDSTVSSIAIAVLTVVLIALMLGLCLLPSIIDYSGPDVVVQTAPKFEEPEKEKPETKPMSRSKPSPPARSSQKLLAVSSFSELAIPVPEIQALPPGADFGEGDFDGYGGDGFLPPGDDFEKIEETMRKRCSKEDRIERLREMGGRPEAEEVVEKGLEWIKATQNSDGSWTAKNRTAMTGFALLAYLGRCETPLSEKYGESCLRGITFLVDVGLRTDGRLAENRADRHWPYEHAIATYALCEATVFCERLGIAVPGLREVAGMGTRVIIANQHRDTGGWDYGYDTEGVRGGDLSISAWHIQALKAASHTGIEFEGMAKAKRRTVEHVLSKQGENGGFGYAGRPSGGGYAKLTGAGMVCLQMIGKGGSVSVRKGAAHLAEHSRFDYLGKDSNLYSQYYDSQAMMARGGADWRKYNAMFRDQLVETQNADGSWKVPGSGGRYKDAHYRNCLNILMLEVYYRFLPGTAPE